jgi:transcriptional regulator with XRE-family HTH domain
VVVPLWRAANKRDGISVHSRFREVKFKFHVSKIYVSELIHTKSGEATLLSDTLAAGLTGYNIGPKIRTLRVNKRLGLTQLSAHTGLSTAMLSKIERGHLFPTLPTLLRIALVFGVGLEHFFVEIKDRPRLTVIRRDERVRLPDRADRRPPCYLFESLDFPVANRKAEVFFALFPLDSHPSEPHQHPGTEVIYVITGQLALDVDGEICRLHTGDVASFDAGAPHSYRREGRAECRAIVVSIPEIKS